MKKRVAASILILLAISISILIVTLPTFFAKELSRTELRQELELEHVLDGSQEIELLFFGYAGCSDICAPRLQAIGNWYSTLEQKMQERLSVKFLDLSIPEERGLPDTFAKAFHKAFTGVFLEQKELRLYTRAFSVYFSPSLLNEREIDHTTHLYLAKRDTKGKELRFIYSAYPYDFKQIQSDIKELIHE